MAGPLKIDTHGHTLQQILERDLYGKRLDAAVFDYKTDANSVKAKDAFVALKAIAQQTPLSHQMEYVQQMLGNLKLNGDLYFARELKKIKSLDEKGKDISDDDKEEIKELLKKYYAQIESEAMTLAKGENYYDLMKIIDDLCTMKIRDTGAVSRILHVPVPTFSRMPTKLELRDTLSPNMGDYLYVKKKSVGENNPGKYGGEYICCYEIKNHGVQVQRALIKQETPAVYSKIYRCLYLLAGWPLDIPLAIFQLIPFLAYGRSPTLIHNEIFRKEARHDKSMVEFVVGRFMNCMIGDSAASINLVRSPWQGEKGAKQEIEPKPIDLTKPDKQDGENVYGISIFFDEFNELYREVYIEDGLTPPGDRPKGMNTPLQYGKPGTGYFAGLTDTFRAHIFARDKELANYQEHCRYENYNETTGQSAAAADMDAHTGNFGVVPIYEVERHADGAVVMEQHPDGRLVVDALGNPKPVLKYDANGKPIPEKLYELEKDANNNVVVDANGLPKLKRDHLGRLIPVYLRNRHGELVRDKDDNPIHAIKKRLVRIDFGGAMQGGLLIRGIEDDVHMHSWARHLFLFGPTNHIREVPRELRVNPRFADELKRIGYRGKFDKVFIAKMVDDTIELAAQHYNLTAFKRFAKQVGFDISCVNLKEHAVYLTKQFLKDKWLARQISLSKTELEIRSSYYIELNTNGEVKDNEHLKKMILDNPNFFKTGNFHFRHRRQKKGDYKTPTLQYADKVLNEAFNDKDFPKFLISDFEVEKGEKRMPLRAEVYIARLRILTRFCSDEKEKENLLEMASDLEKWRDKFLNKFLTDQSRYTTSFAENSQKRANRTHLLFLCDRAFCEVRQTYKKLAVDPVKKEEIDSLMDIAKGYELTEKSEQERYAKRITRISRSVDRILEQKEKAAKTAANSYPATTAYAPTFFNHPRSFSNANAYGISSEAAAALHNAANSLDELAGLLEKLTNELNQFYGKSADASTVTPPSSPRSSS